MYACVLKKIITHHTSMYFLEFDIFSFGTVDSWNTYLSIDCKKGGWTPEEDRILLQVVPTYLAYTK